MHRVNARSTVESIPTVPSPLRREVEPLLRKLQTSPGLSPQSQAKFLDLLNRFGAFLAAGHGVTPLTDVTRAHVVLFITAVPAGATSIEPAAATMHLVAPPFVCSSVSRESRVSRSVTQRSISRSPLARTGGFVHSPTPKSRCVEERLSTR